MYVVYRWYLCTAVCTYIHVVCMYCMYTVNHTYIHVHPAVECRTIILFCVLDPPNCKRLKKYQTLVPATRANDNPAQNGTLRCHLVFQIANMICLNSIQGQREKEEEDLK